MKAFTVALVFLTHHLSAQKPWALDDGRLATPEGMVVQGTPELAPRKAYEAALSQAVENLREARLERGRALAAAAAPAWMPAVFTERVVRDWASRQDYRASLQVIDRDELVRDHGFGQSYQASLLVRTDETRLARGERELQWDLDRSARKVKRALGMSVGSWVLIALIASWLDRLSRGYMTFRLFAIGGLVGIIVPAVLLLA